MSEREFRIIRSIADELRAIHQEIKSIGDASTRAAEQHDKQPVSPLRVEVQTETATQHAIREYYESENREHRGWLGRNRGRIELLGVGAALLVAIFAVLTNYEIRRQTPGIMESGNAAVNVARTASDQLKLMKDQLILTQSARVVVHAAFQAQRDNSTKILLTLFNDGHESAVGTSATLTASEKDLHGATVQMFGPLVTSAAYDLTPTQDRTGPYWLDTHRADREYSLPFRADKLRNTESTLELTGTLRYNNGFEDVSAPVCLSYATYANEGISDSAEFVPCRDLQSVLATALQTKEGYAHRR